MTKILKPSISPVPVYYEQGVTILGWKIFINGRKFPRQNGCYYPLNKTDSIRRAKLDKFLIGSEFFNKEDQK